MTSEAEFLSAYESIKTSYRQAMAQIDKAISYEEQEQAQQAITAYEQSLDLIEKIFAMPVGLPEDIDNVAAEWTDACLLIQKLKSAKTEISYRMKVLRAQHAPIENAAEANELEIYDDNAEASAAKQQKSSMLLENPSTYYDISDGRGSAPKTYREIINTLRSVIAIKNVGIHYDTLFHAQAKLYKIQPNGVVSTMSGETTISLIMCTALDETWKFLNSVCFLQCAMPATTDNAPSTAADAKNSETCNVFWIYPLIPAVTICYRTEYGAFILPDMESDVPGTAFGIMISDPNNVHTTEEPAELTDLEQFFLDLMEAVLAGSVELLEQTFERRTPRDTSEQVSRQIISAADFVARNLIKGAEKTGELMVKSTPYIISKMTAAPPDAPEVSSKVQTTVAVAKNVTSVAAGVTGWVAGKVGSASMAVGRFLAPHIQTQGAVLLQKGFGYNSTEANSKMENALTIAAGAAEGFSTVVIGLETSAKILGTNLSENSVKIIEHKYGPSAGNVASGTFDTLGNAFVVSENVHYIHPKGFAKKMFKHTGRAVVADYNPNLRGNGNFIPAGQLYPDLRTLKEKSD